MIRIAFLILPVFFFNLSEPCAYEVKTHGKNTQAAVDLIRKTDSLKIYEELYDKGYARQIVVGSEAGDFGNIAGNNRSFRHYYDPDSTVPKKGVKYFDYYRLWAYFDIIKNLVWQSQGRWIENLEVTPPAGGYYDDALEWARNSAGAGDLMNWEGALRAYDYTTSARAQAYRRLGYVSHLVADMAQPDHVFNYPHPGSSYRREDGEKVYYGFEALVENYIDVVDFPGKEVRKSGSLDDHFNEVVKISKNTAGPARYKLPLGLETQTFSFDMYKIPGLVEGASKDDASMTRIFEAKDVAIIPAIDDNDPAERKKYLDLARELLNQAVEYNAGTLELFYDIVNQPPYVADVTVTQGGEARYHGWYEETYGDVREQLAGVASPANYKRVSVRHLHKSDYPLESGKEAAIRVTFGPSEDAEEHIDPASVKVSVGDIEVPGAMTSSRVWEGSFAYSFESKEPKEAFPIKISAKDIHNHSPRAGLPRQGYELDSDPGTPVRLSGYKPPYPWKDYEPGPDSNHSIVIRQTVPPPIAESIEVFSPDAYFVRSRWIVPSEAEARKGKAARLEKDTAGVKDGMDIGKVDSAEVRIVFSQIMDDETLRLKLGALDLPLSRIDEFTYEAAIPLAEFNRPGSDQAHRFEITGKGISGLELDAHPDTVAAFDDKKGRWIALETGADTTHTLRIYGQIEAPMLKGIVHEMETSSSSGRPSVGKPLAGWNVVMYAGSIEVDGPLCEEAARLARSYRAAKQKEDSEALNLLKDKVKSSCRVLYGTMPGWIVKTDSEGRFAFPLHKEPGRAGVIKAYYTFFVFPPDSVETDDPRSALSDTLAYDIFFDRNYLRTLDYWTRYYVDNGLISNALGGAVNAATPFLEIASEAQRQRLASLLDGYKRSAEEERLALEEITRLKGRLTQISRSPGGIEKTWQERALKLQREFEKGFRDSHGPSSGWNEETRKAYQEKMYELPKTAKAAWQEDMGKFEKEKRKAEEDLKKAGSAHSGRKSRLAQEELFAAWQDIYYDMLIAMALRGDRQPPVSSVYEIDGTVSGEEMVPPAKGGYITEVYLIKRGLDESRTKESVVALSVDTQSRIVTGDLNDPKSHRPPYRFRFTEKIPEHLAINRYVRLSSGSLKVIPVGAGSVFFELSPSGDARKFTDRAIDALWNNFKAGKLEISRN